MKERLCNNFRNKEISLQSFVQGFVLCELSQVTIFS